MVVQITACNVKSHNLWTVLIQIASSEIIKTLSVDLGTDQCCIPIGCVPEFQNYDFSRNLFYEFFGPETEWYTDGTRK